MTRPQDMRTIVFTDGEFETAISDEDIGSLIAALQQVSTWADEIAEDIAGGLHYGEVRRMDAPDTVYEVKSNEQAAAILGAIELCAQEGSVSQSMRVLRNRLQGRKH